MANQKGKPGLAYEAAIARLEEVVRALETGEVPLDDSLKLFQEGIGLVRHCHLQLDAYEAKVQKLIESPKGVTIIEEPAQPSAETTVAGLFVLEEGE
ncbi:exodeoxyribonuclease VII small subunit [Heliobacillus mobilis]|uniref:Exodeoxyribonuclease 7 small subunit n=2 Tax=Heliobacterium TaxID=2697 RepID=A0A6I3SK62_HELMO|nr:exodeoxyribonuclease VII small subunit [Heliobacterium mobile]MBC9784894.1 exodeoxyribonuclease VII small subunit [Heliobacterium chlorum]MTV49328.1 exodeoxyribonuclease VII small subunit [Heliobacterium mobile]